METTPAGLSLSTILLGAIASLASVVAFLFQTAWKSRTDMIDRMAQSVAKAELEADGLRKELADAHRQYAALQERASAASVKASVLEIVSGRAHLPPNHPADHSGMHPVVNTSPPPAPEPPKE